MHAIPRVERAEKRTKQPPVLFQKTQAIVTRLEHELGCRFLSYWNSRKGSICGNDVNVFYEILRQVGPSDQIALMIKSDGGTGKASLRIVHLLREFAPKLSALVALDCASAATMLALGADEIKMGPLAYLTPVDTSLTHDLSPVDVDNDRVAVSQDELTRIVRLWRAEGGVGNPYRSLFKHVHPLVIGAVDRASSLSIKLCRDILSYHLKDEARAEAISNQLNAEYPAHSYPITYKEAQRIGLNVSPLETKVNDLLIELNELYSEMGQRAVTDYDEQNHHDNEILSVTEGRGVQVFYQIDKDWHYRKEERRWVAMNDESAWWKVAGDERHFEKTALHLR